LVLPGLPHYLTRCGNRHQQTFSDEEPSCEYCRLLSISFRNCATQVLACWLMPNHVHLILVPADEVGLRDALAGFHRRYTPLVSFREGWWDTFGGSGFNRS
jgi:putative transposase